MPASLAMCRLLKRHGASVIGTDSLAVTPLMFSNCVDVNATTASPALRPDQFINDLITLAKKHDVTHIYPMYEEGFVVSKFRQKLEHELKGTELFIGKLEQLALLDDKFNFIEHCEKLDLPVPKTIFVASTDALNAAVKTIDGEVVVKPVFSRFANNIYLRPSPEELATIQPCEENPWVVQELISGDVISSYGICHQGVVKVHADYNNEFVTGAKSKQGLGASSSFQPRQLQGTREFANKLFGSINYTGQYGLDFILGPNGPACIECNPRSTSGVHLYEKCPDFAKILLGCDVEREPHPSGASNHLQLFRSIASGETKINNPRLRQSIFCRDVIFDLYDPKPVKGFRKMMDEIKTIAEEQNKPAADVFFEDLACEPR